MLPLLNLQERKQVETFISTCFLYFLVTTHH